MNILVINAGSSSLKYQLIDIDTEDVIAKGVCERIGIGGSITHKNNKGNSITKEIEFPTHKEAFLTLVDILVDSEYGVIAKLEDIHAIGHRVVQGAENFCESVLITDDVLNTIIEISDLAPLHNPAHVLSIKACRDVFGDKIPQVATFDTAFHQSMPDKAYMYALPYEYYEKYNIRKYGFHGTSHRYVSRRLSDLLDIHIMDLKIVSCHIGNGASIAAIDGGKSVDTSMGFTPLDGLIMGTRCGSIDPSAVLYLMDKENLNLQQINDILNKESGFIGVSGVTSDDRDLRKAAAAGNKRAYLAGKMQRYQIKKLIGAYAAAMGGLDAVVFTGGIGENSTLLREKVCDYMSFLGIDFDKERNMSFNGKEAQISKDKSKVKVYIIPTNEELLIARDTTRLLNRIK